MDAYTDRPRPSTAYRLFLLVGPGVLGACLGLGELLLGANGHALLTLLVPAWVLFSLVFLYTADHTEYRIHEGVLDVRMGRLRRQSVPLWEITSIRSVSVLPLRDGCNRFRHGLRISAGKRHLYLTPSAPAVFLAQVSHETTRMASRPVRDTTLQETSG